MSPSPKRPWALLALVALTLLTYAPSLGNGFIWDDDHYVTANVELRSLQGLASTWLEPGSREHLYGQYYPLVHTTFWIEHQLWGDAPLGYHAVNALLHALAAVLLFWVLRRLELPGAWLAAALFAVHPVQVESVAWITERKNVLSAVLDFASALAFLSWAGVDAARPSAAGRARWWLIAFALFVAALLAKTVTASLPAALLLVLWWKRGRVAAREVLALLPFFAAGLALALLTVHLEHTVVGAAGPEWALTPLQRSLIAGRALWFYAGKLAWPANLSFIYPRWEVGPGDVLGWIAVAGALLLVLSLWLARRRIGRGPLVAVLFFGGTLLPALGFVNVFPMRYSFVADHFQYLACVGIFALAASLGSDAVGRRLGPRAALAGAALLLALLAGLSWQRQSAYRDAETLWRDTVRRNPGAWMAWNNLGMLRAERGQLDEAVLDFEESLRLHPRHQQAESNLGLANLQLGRDEDAIEHYRRALQIDPSWVGAHRSLGLALLRTGRGEEAVPHLVQALELEPDEPELHHNLGLALAMADELPQAIWHDEHALELRPDFAEAHVSLGKALMQSGRREEAVAHWQRALELSPQDAEAWALLGNVLLDERRLPEAIEHYERSLELAPDQAGTHYFLAVALGLADRLGEALPHFELAVQLNPDFPEAHYNLALALAAAGRREEAIEQGRLALALRPDWIEARVNLGEALLAAGRVDEAAEELQEALRRKPDVPEAQFLLGATWRQANRLPEAIAAYEAGLALRPDDVYGQLRLGQVLAASGDAAAARTRYDEAVRLDPACAPALAAAARVRATSADEALRDGAEAVRLALRACELTERGQVGPLDTLAAAYAETGRFAEAVATAQEALVLAQSAGPAADTSELAAHLELFEAGKPLRDVAGP